MASTAGSGDSNNGVRDICGEEGGELGKDGAVDTGGGVLLEDGGEIATEVPAAGPLNTGMATAGATCTRTGFFPNFTRPNINAMSNTLLMR